MKPPDPLYNNSDFTSDYLKYLEEDNQPEWQEDKCPAFTVLQSTLNLKMNKTWDFLNKIVLEKYKPHFSRFDIPDIL